MDETPFGDVASRSPARSRHAVRQRGAMVCSVICVAACGSGSTTAQLSPAPLAQGPYLLIGLNSGGNEMPEFAAYDWRGTLRGGFGPIQECPAPDPCFQPQFAADGSRAILAGDVIGPSGASIGALPAVGGSGYTWSLDGWRWADDSRHLCAVGVPGYYSPPASPATSGIANPGIVGPWPGAPNALYLATLGGAVHQVAKLDVGGSGDITTILACSMTADRALTLTQLLPGGQDAVLRLTRLTDGTTIAERRMRFTADQVTLSPRLLVASPDGRMLATNGADFTQSRTVLDVVSGADVGTPAVGTVHAFSFDDRRMIESSKDGVRIVDLTTGTVSWTSAEAFCGSVVRPDDGAPDVAVCVGSHFAVWVIPATGKPFHVADGGLATSDAGP